MTAFCLGHSKETVQTQTMNTVWIMGGLAWASPKLKLEKQSCLAEYIFLRTYLWKVHIITISDAVPSCGLHALSHVTCCASHM